VYEGEAFLYNASLKHMMPMPDIGIPARYSERAQSMSPIDLAQDSFSSSPEEVAPSVTPSVRKAAKKRPPRHITQSDVVLSESHGSDEEIVYVAQRRKKVKSAPTSQSSDEVEVVDQSGLSLEVETQDLPKTGHFGECHSPRPPVVEEAAPSLGSETVVDEESENLLADEDSDE
jgi:hypothetical protein